MISLWLAVLYLIYYGFVLKKLYNAAMALQFKNGSLLMSSRERFPSASSVLDCKSKSRKTRDVTNEFDEFTKGLSLRRVPQSISDNSKDWSFKGTPNILRKKLSNSKILPANRYKQNDSDHLKRISTAGNPFSFSENPVSIQRRLQTLGTSDLQALPWTELEEDGTLYNTLLKKVRYTSHALEDLHQAANYTAKQWEMVKVKQMKAATIEKLVEHLTPASQEVSDFDPGFFLAFLCTYKSFTTTTAVVDLLLKRFEHFESGSSETNEEKNMIDGVMRRICSVISIWIEQYPRDFDEPPNYDSLNKLIHFFRQRTEIPVVQKIYQICDLKLNTLTVSPFDDETPLKFKFCSCVSIVGCTCSTPRSRSIGNDDDDVFTFDAELFAEQLTLIDAELFLRVVPRECLATFWSKRDAAKGSKAQSIKLTVDQFNAVSLKVISTILDVKNKKTGERNCLARSKTICKWINIALELREFKNFSSLKAVISGLQSSAIYRLNRSWELVPKLTKEIYDDLSTIFSDDLNSKASRDLLMQEGTSKYSTMSLRRSKPKRQSWMKSVCGTVPYLGTFLTDLMMIDTAFPDMMKDDLINFEKRRKEFEIVVQIKLLQQSAKNYKFEPNEAFCSWFNSLSTYGDKEGYEKSIEVEPPLPKVQQVDGASSPLPLKKQFSLRKYLSESDLLHKLEKDRSKSMNIDEPDTNRSNTNSLPAGVKLKLKKSDSSLSSSIQNLFQKSHHKANSISSRSSLHPDDQPCFDDNGVIARVYLEGMHDIQYKSIRITPNSRACDVISAILEKCGCPDAVSEYSLYQVIDYKSTCYVTYHHIRKKKSLHIPMNSNMYYAMNRTTDMCFRVAKKRLSKNLSKNNSNISNNNTKDSLKLPVKSPTSPTTSSTFKLLVGGKNTALEDDCIKLTSFNPL